MLKENSDLLYLILGVGVGAMTSFAKSLKNVETFTKQGIIKMCAEALTCSLLTSGLSISLNEYYGLSYSYAICIGAFIGSMGSTVIIEFARSVLLRIAGVSKNESK